MFCGTTVDLMAKMMTAGRRLVSFWRTHSILEGPGWSHWGRVPLALGSPLAPVLAVRRGSAWPSSPAESLLSAAAYLPKETGLWVGGWLVGSLRSSSPPLWSSISTQFNWN